MATMCALIKLKNPGLNRKNGHFQAFDKSKFKKCPLYLQRERERESQIQIQVGIFYHQRVFSKVANTHWVFSTIALIPTTEYLLP